MKCQEVQERLSEYLEKSLDEQSTREVQDHLASCPRCSSEASALAQNVQAVGDLPSLEAPPDFSKQVMARIQGESGKPKLWQRLFLPLRVKIPIQAAAILLVSGFAFYLFQVNQQSQLEMTDRSVMSEPKPAPTPAAEPQGRAVFEAEEDRQIPKEKFMEERSSKAQRNLYTGGGSCGASHSSCYFCHEAKGEMRALSNGAHHKDHAFGDFCVFCHGGKVEPQSKAEAHEGLRANPMSDVEKSCSGCHPDDFQTRGDGYRRESLQ